MVKGICLLYSVANVSINIFIRIVSYLLTYRFFRYDLALAEERQILLQFAPHLLHHFTPALMEKLDKLGQGA